MNYLKFYFALVSKAAGRKKCVLYDGHHIIPTSIGGPNIDTNLIYFTPREHVIAHHLLAKAYPEVEKLQSGFNVKHLKHFDAYRYTKRVQDCAQSLIEAKPSKRQELLDNIKMLCDCLSQLDVNNAQFPPIKKVEPKKNKIEKKD